MRLYIVFIFLLISFSNYAQISPQFLKGSWVKMRIEYKNGEQLSNDLQARYSYVRYEFVDRENMSICTDYRWEGIKLGYTVTGNLLELKNSYGYVVNSLLLEKMTKDEIVILQKGLSGFDAPDCIRYYFAPETVYQRSLPMTPDDILMIRGDDTTFRASAKFYASYSPNQSFFGYLEKNIPEYQKVSSNTDGRFVATFIVDKTGKADSLRILEGVNEAFDTQFIKAFKKAKLWQKTAENNGKKVAVQMTQTFSFFSSKTFLPSYDFAAKGKAAMQRHEYDQALYFFDEALKNIPDNADNLYYRAVCKLALGNKDGACKDFAEVKRLGSSLADELILKNCK